MMKRVRGFLSCVMVIAFMTSCGVAQISFEEKVGFEEFYEYKDILGEIAQLSLDLYRTDNHDERIFISFYEEDVIGNDGRTSTRFDVDEELVDLILRLKESEIPCTLTYLIVGDTYVTFTRDGQTFSIMYSEDDVRPRGIWKYEEDDIKIAKYEKYWYELFNNSLGDHP